METLQMPASGSRQEKYEALLPQIFQLIEGESDWIANLANVSAALKQGLGFFWVGFYLVKRPLAVKGKGDSPGELVLGPFQGPIACTRIAYGKGVCGTSWAQKKTILVPDVDRFPGHIACSTQSRSEIVIPLLSRTREVMGVLDVDSDQLNDFSEVDERYLTRLVEKLVF